MLITRAQGAACRRAAERIADSEPREDGYFMLEPAFEALSAIGWGTAPNGRFIYSNEYPIAHQSQVLMALLWCAEIAGE